MAKWIDAHGWKRDDFAARVGIVKPSLDRLCRGERTPSLAVAIEIEKLTRGAVPARCWAKAPSR